MSLPAYSLYALQDKRFCRYEYNETQENMMNIGFTRNQELAAEQLRAISPLVHMARQVFISISLLSTGTAVGKLEMTARDKSLPHAKSILMLEQDLMCVIAGKA